MDAHVGCWWSTHCSAKGCWWLSEINCMGQKVYNTRWPRGVPSHHKINPVKEIIQVHHTGPRQFALTRYPHQTRGDYGAPPDYWAPIHLSHNTLLLQVFLINRAGPTGYRTIALTSYPHQPAMLEFMSGSIYVNFSWHIGDSHVFINQRTFFIPVHFFSNLHHFLPIFNVYQDYVTKQFAFNKFLNY